MAAELKISAFILLILLVGIGPVTGQDVSLSVSKSGWNVGISLLRTETPADNDTVLLSTAALIPRLIADSLTDIADHRLSSPERRALAEEQLKQEIRSASDTLASLRNKRDRMFFQPNIDTESLRLQDEKIREARDNLSLRQQYRPEDVQVPEVLPVVFSGSGGVEASVEDGGLMNVQNFDADSFRRYQKLDVLIYGNLSRVGDYFGLQILACGVDGTEILWEGAVGEAGLKTAAAEAADRAKSLLLGRPWASLTVAVRPRDAVISLNGNIVGVGTWSSGNLSPGAYSLEFTSPGHQPLVREIRLEEEQVLVLDPVLETAEQMAVLVQTVPTGADVYLGSFWMGRTPLSLTLPDRVRSLSFSKDGYRSRTLPFYPDSARLTVPLENNLSDPVEELDRSRKKLQNSIAWFSLSLAPTIVLLGISQNYAYKNLNSTDPQDINDSYYAYQTTRGIMFGTLGVNALLLTNVLIKLSRYLKAAEGLSE